MPDRPYDVEICSVKWLPVERKLYGAGCNQDESHLAMDGDGGEGRIEEKGVVLVQTAWIGWRIMRCLYS